MGGSATVGFGIVLGLVLTVIWAVTGARYFWPGWIWFALALPVASYWSVRWALRLGVAVLWPSTPPSPS